MSEPQVVVVVQRTAAITNWISAFWQTAGLTLNRAGAWATSTSQRFGSVVSALMGPAIVSLYVLALWSLTADIGWTGAFIVSSGPLSNWLVWLGIAVLLHGASAIMKRHGGRS